MIIGVLWLLDHYALYKNRSYPKIDGLVIFKGLLLAKIISQSLAPQNHVLKNNQLWQKCVEGTG